jgi:hypothetical protein
MGACFDNADDTRVLEKAGVVKDQGGWQMDMFVNEQVAQLI